MSATSSKYFPSKPHGEEAKLSLEATMSREFARTVLRINGMGGGYSMSEMAKFGCDLAEALVKEFEARGWIESWGREG